MVDEVAEQEWRDVADVVLTRQRLEARRARNAERMRRKRCRDDAKSRYVTRSDAH